MVSPAKETPKVEPVSSPTSSSTKLTDSLELKKQTELKNTPKISSTEDAAAKAKLSDRLPRPTKSFEDVTQVIS